MLFWSAVLNGVLAPPLIVIVLLLTSNRAIMGARSNPLMAGRARVDHRGCDDGAQSRDVRGLEVTFAAL